MTYMLSFFLSSLLLLIYYQHNGKKSSGFQFQQEYALLQQSLPSLSRLLRSLPIPELLKHWGLIT